jgi:hypothetical protein
MSYYYRNRNGSADPTSKLRDGSRIRFISNKSVLQNLWILCKRRMQTGYLGKDVGQHTRFRPASLLGGLV